MSEHQEIQNGSILERPSFYHKEEGFLRGFSWDRNANNEKKSALAFFGFTRSHGQNSENKTYVKYAVRVRGRDAAFLEDVHNWLLNEKNAGNKQSALISLDCTVSSYERKTGEKWGENNENDKTESITYFEGKGAILLNAKTREVLGQGKLFLYPHEMQQQA